MSLEEKRQKDLALYSPKNCFKHSQKIRTVKDVLRLPSKTLGEFKRLYGRDWVIAYITMWIIELNDNSNVKNKMNDAQMEFTAERIYESYSLKITDLTLFFRNMKEGSYGPYYESLSQDKILQWLKQYYDLRCEYAEMFAQQKHDGFSLTKDKMNPEVIEKIFKGVGGQKPEYDHEKNGLGKRMSGVLNKKFGEDKTEIFKKVKALKDSELKKYIATTDFNSENFDPFYYKIAIAEIDQRKQKI